MAMDRRPMAARKSGSSKRSNDPRAPEGQISTRQFVLSGGSCCYRSLTRAASERLERTCPASPVGGKPQDHVTNDHCLYLNGTRVHLKGYAPARTDGEVLADIKGFRRPPVGEAVVEWALPVRTIDQGKPYRGAYRTRWGCREKSQENRGPAILKFRS